MTSSQNGKISSIIVFALALSACSSYEKRQIANGKFKYLSESESEEIVVPEQLQEPQFNSEFDIPAVGDYRSEPYGDQLRISSPKVVIAAAAGTHVEEGSKTAQVLFDKINDKEDLDTSIWNAVIGLLEKNDIGVNNFDKDKQELITDWIINEENISKGILGWVGVNRENRSEGSRFKINLELRPHGRTGLLSAQLLDHLETIDDDVVENNSFFNNRDAEIELLNQILLHYDFQNRLAEAKKLDLVRQGIDVELGFDYEGNPAFVMSAPFEIVWARLILVSQQLGFTLSDFDQSSGILYVNYQNEGGSWWSNLWGSSNDGLPIEERNYQFKVLDKEGLTTISLLNENGEPENAEVINQLFPEFSKVMASARLGI